LRVDVGGDGAGGGCALGERCCQVAAVGGLAAIGVAVVVVARDFRSVAGNAFEAAGKVVGLAGGSAGPRAGFGQFALGNRQGS
jgi:hypothetical protein